jgi:hypothetical protein
METSTELDALAEALAEFQGAPKAVQRNRTVKVKGTTKNGKEYSYDFKYATLDHILDVIREPMKDTGLSVIQGVSADEGGLSITTRLMHKSGQWMESTMPIYLGPDKSPQAVGSAITYAKRYSLTAMLGIVADEDDDGNAAEGNQMDVQGRKSPTQKAAPKQKADADPEHVRMAKGLLAKLQQCGAAAETDALWDESQPILADIQKASDATFKHITAQFDKAKKALAEKEAA